VTGVLKTEQTAILGGSWLLALWGRLAPSGALRFAIASLAPGVGAGWLPLGATHLARWRDAPRVPADPGSGSAAESDELQGMRATLRGLEAELQAIDDRGRTAYGLPDAGSAPAGQSWT